MAKGVVVAIGIAPEEDGPVQRVPEARAVAGRGLEGDHNYRSGDAAEDPERELTLVEAEAVEAFCAETGEKLDPLDSRRNVVTRGIRLNDLVGKEFSVGGTRLAGMRLCQPCSHLQKLTGVAVLPGLMDRAGLRARILAGGTIRVGDAVEA